MSAVINIPAPRKAEKKKVKLKLGIQGPSGSGKTFGALALATNLWPGAKICVVDAENGSAELYADRFEFDTIPLTPPFSTDRYIGCIDVAVKHGYDVLIIDQISHQWDGEGGILRRKEEMDRRPGANSWTNWSFFTPEHERFKSAIVQAPIHIIATMRSKQDYILETNDKGKQQPRKVGMAAVQREGFEYEFSLAFDLQMDHRGTVTKDRTSLFDEQIIDLAAPKVAEAIRGWLDKGVDAKPEPTPISVQPQSQQTPGPSLVQSQQNSQPRPFSYKMGQLICSPVDVALRKSKSGEDCAVVILNGRCENTNVAYCRNATLFDAVAASLNKQVQFQVSAKDGFLYIDDVDFIEGVEYREGKPWVEPKRDPEQQTFITDDDIPF